VSIMAPKQVKPGADVTLEVKAQPKSLVAILAVDLGVYLLDSSYDLQKNDILYSLEVDISGLPFLALVYPGLLSGLVTLTNAHYEFVPLLQNYEITNDTTQLTLKIPDTITTWRLTAFSMNEETGFGIVHGPTDITTIQPFFITLNLPYSVKRGEIVAIPIQIHNYLNETLDTEISLINAKEEFYFMESTIFNRETGSTEQQRTKHVTMPANGVDTVSFLINPRLAGYIELKITAKNRLASDGIIEKLRVEPEGIKKEFNKIQNINVIPSGPVELSIPLTMHSNMVLQSEVISLSVVGDNMAPVLLNLNDLVNLPTGCGEQNMADFAPNVLALQYLKLTGQYHREAKLVSKAKRFIEIGYQQQLTYRHDNGGYSVFGQRQDLEASTWLTAYTIRFFIKSLKYAIPIERHIIESGLDYLATAQREDGSFPYTGYLIDPSQQNRFGFTAFILMTFLEDEKLARKHPITIRKGLNFLSGSMNRTNDMYALSIMAVTLQMAKNYTTSRTILDKIIQRKKSSHDLVWWSQNDRNMAKDVEITGYVLMAMLEIGYSVEVAKKAFNWLTQQRNAKGGFQSSQDTVVGVQALIKYSVKYRVTGSINVTVNYTAMDNNTQIVKIGEMVVDARNMKIVQMEELPKTTRAVKILATGFGNCSLQLTYQYYTNGEDSFQYFQLAPKVELLNPAEMSLEICFSYIEPSSKATNMVVMEVNLPSGFSGDEKDMDELLENDIVQRIEMKNSETTIIVYSAQLMAEEKSCLSLMAYKIHDVVYRKAAAIIIYDYYNISRHDTVFYKIVAETAQDHSSKVENTPITLDNENSIF
uniref:A-macroglobulin complement component n=1 Tax=Musca domestica TaxID=7370 RepID=A0A1I8MLC1_MUSDO